jgi:hypothetical protein
VAEDQQLREERGQYLSDMKAILKKAEDEKRDINAEESRSSTNSTARRAAQGRRERYERAQSLEAELADKRGEQRSAATH